VTGKKITQHTHIRHFDVWYVTDDDVDVGVASRVRVKKFFYKIKGKEVKRIFNRNSN